MNLRDQEWGRKSTTLSDKSARQEYGLTHDEIYTAIGAGRLQYRPAAMHGNPWQERRAALLSEFGEEGPPRH